MTAFDSSCFRTIQLKIETSDSTRDSGRVTSDSSEKSGGASMPPEYRLPKRMPYQLS
jgi:hypothetical protein